MKTLNSFENVRSTKINVNVPFKLDGIKPLQEELRVVCASTTSNTRPKQVLTSVNGSKFPKESVVFASIIYHIECPRMYFDTNWNFFSRTTGSIRNCRRVNLKARNALSDSCWAVTSDRKKQKTRIQKPKQTMLREQWFQKIKSSACIVKVLTC